MPMTHAVRCLPFLPLALCCAAAIGQDGAASENIIPNGDFSKGNADFKSGLPYIKPAFNCLWGGYYTITSKFNDPLLHKLIAHEGFPPAVRKSGNEKVLFANAGGVEPVLLWSTVAKCKPNTRYLITFNCISLSGNREEGTMSHQVPDTSWAADFEIVANDAESAPIQPGLGKYFKGGMLWDSHKSTTVNLQIIRMKFAHGGGIVGISNIEMVPAKD